MRIFLGLMGVLAWVLAVQIFSEAQSAIHEIEALILLLIGMVGIGCASIVTAIQATQTARPPVHPQPSPHLPMPPPSMPPRHGP